MQKIEVKNASVDFYKRVEDGVNVYEFDTSMCEPPHPMINAMAGLALLDKNSKLVMINHKKPMGLFPKIEGDFDYEVEDIEGGKVKVTFSKKADAKGSTDFSSNHCAG